jgi:hypothetical protein
MPRHLVFGRFGPEGEVESLESGYRNVLCALDLGVGLGLERCFGEERIVSGLRVNSGSERAGSPEYYVSSGI